MTFCRDKLVCWFIKNYPEYYSDMLDSQHYVDRFQPNVFHSEGSVWTHTMMVMTWIEAKHQKEDDPINKDYVVLLTSGLLHDLGKPDCEELNEANDTKPIRNSFKGHEGVSVMKGVGVLKALKAEFPEIYSDEVIELVIKIVGTHGVAIEGPDGEFRKLREKFRIADKKGAVRQVDEGLFSQYGGRNFSSTSKVEDGKELVIFVGTPCSGKSTLIDKDYNDYVRVSRDNQMMVWFRQTEPEAPKMSYNEVYRFIHGDNEKQKEFNDYFEKYIGSVAKNEDKVVVDMTMMPASSRRKMMNKFPKHTRKCVVVMTDMLSLKSRNMARQQLEGKGIPDGVFLNMAKSFTYPVVEEGFTKIELVIN